MDGEREIKSFISSIKNAIMSTSVETLKEDQLQGVLNSFRDANFDISKYFKIPPSIKIFKDSTAVFLCDVDENFLDTLKSFKWGWTLPMEIPKIFSCSSEDTTDSIPYHLSIKGINVGVSKLQITFVYTKINNPISEKINFNIPITVSIR